MAYTVTENGPLRVSTPTKTEPKVIVWVMGWIGAKMKHVMKYNSLYSESAIVILGILPPYAFFSLNKWAMEQFVKRYIDETAPLLRIKPELPLFIHSFSNNDGLCVARLGRMLAESPNDDTRLVAEAWSKGGTINDSSPAVITLTELREVVGHAIPNPILFSILWAFVVLYYHAAKTHSCLLNKPDLLEQYYKELQDESISHRSGYIYSTTDTITPYLKLEDFIEGRKEVVGPHNVTTLKFTDTDHVLHMKKHPEEYKSFVVRFFAQGGVELDE